MRTIGIGLIGGGFMGKAHSLALAALPLFFSPAPLSVRTIVADATEELAREAARRFGYDRWTSDWRRVVEAPDVDAVHIVTPNHLHAEIAIAAAASGKHVLCEKPLGLNADETARMLDAVERAGVVHMVAFTYRHLPAIALARRLLDEGVIGRPHTFRGSFLADWAVDPAAPISWRDQRHLAGSGALGDLGSHIIHLAHHLVGDIVAVCALSETYVRTRPQGVGSETTPVDTDDETLSLLRFRGGAIGVIQVTRSAPGRDNALSFEIHGDRGSLAFDYARREQLSVSLSDTGGQRRVQTIGIGSVDGSHEGLWPNPGLGLGYTELKTVECYRFLEAIMKGKPAAPTFRHGHAVVQVGDAILASAAGKRWVDVADGDRDVSAG